jgi:uncharacterized glyoxalase superfamily protein PhnB
MPRLDAIGLVVADLDASRAFYAHLGLDVPADDAGHGHVEAAVGGLRIMFDTVETVKSFDSSWQPPSAGQRMSLAFLCDSPDEVDRVHDALVAAGHQSHKPPWDAVWGQRYAQVRDPDGNVVDLFARLGE